MKTPTLSLRRKQLTLKKARGAFSLIELLVVIAVIGIIAAIAIPNIGNLTSGADTAKNQRNAQNLASVFSAARAAGNVTPYTTVTEAVTALTTSPGITGANNVGSFYVPNLVNPERAAAERHLTIQPAGGGPNAQLIYNKEAAEEETP